MTALAPVGGIAYSLGTHTKQSHATPRDRRPPHIAPLVLSVSCVHGAAAVFWAGLGASAVIVHIREAIKDLLTEIDFFSDDYRKEESPPVQRPRPHIGLPPFVGELIGIQELRQPEFLAKRPEDVALMVPDQLHIVYGFLGYADGGFTPLYVGQTRWASWRISQHTAGSRGIRHGLRAFELRGFSIQVAVWVSCECMLNTHETELIEALAPILNRDPGPGVDHAYCTCGGFA